MGPEGLEGSAMSLTARLREPAGEPEGALILLHGRGVDEHDLFPLLDLLDPTRRLLGATPRGPLSLPPGAPTGTSSAASGIPTARRSWPCCQRSPRGSTPSSPSAAWRTVRP